MAFVRCGLYKSPLPSFSAKKVPGAVFQNTCSWLEVEVVAHGGSIDRAELRGRVLHKESQNEFLGFCRARNAVIEATILATRLAICDRATVHEKLSVYKEIVEKTGDATEREAFQLVHDYIRQGGTK